MIDPTDAQLESWAMGAMGWIFDPLLPARWCKQVGGEAVVFPRGSLFTDANLLREFRRFTEREWGLWVWIDYAHFNLAFEVTVYFRDERSSYYECSVMVPHDNTDDGKDRAEAKAVLLALWKARNA